MKRLVKILLAAALAVAPVGAQQTAPPSTMPTPTTPVPPGAPSPTPPPGRGQAPGRGTMPPTTPPPAQATGQYQPRPEPPSSWQNVKVDVVVVDSGTPEPQNRKSVSMLVLDGRSGLIRTFGNNAAVINVDATPTVRPDGRIYLRVTFEYRVEPIGPTTPNAPSINISESLFLVLPDGKPVTVSQAADPRSERKVTVEITSTVQK